MADLPHVDESGKARMVDVGAKSPTARRARASGFIRMATGTLDLIERNQMEKGDVLSVARIAGIMAAKKTADLIPLCHPLPLDDVQVRIAADHALPGLRVEAEAGTTGRTGVEMEAMVGVMVTLVTVYDMAKGHDRGMVISEIRLEEKTGGKSGTWTRG
jgi:cyclic pyranopterin monophosphate synthase